MVERETGPKFVMERSKGHQELGCCLVLCCVSKTIGQKSVPLVGCPALPFIDQGGAGVIDGRKRKKPKVEKVLRGSRVSLLCFVAAMSVSQSSSRPVYALV